MKKLSAVENKEVIKKTVYSKLNRKINNLENRIPDVTTLIYKNQYNTYKQSLEEKMNKLINKYLKLVV